MVVLLLLLLLLIIIIIIIIIINGAIKLCSTNSTLSNYKHNVQLQAQAPCFNWNPSTFPSFRNQGVLFSWKLAKANVSQKFHPPAVEALEVQPKFRCSFVPGVEKLKHEPAHCCLTQLFVLHAYVKMIGSKPVFLEDKQLKRVRRCQEILRCATSPKLKCAFCMIVVYYMMVWMYHIYVSKQISHHIHIYIYN